ncbi:MAG: hypothetical protein AB7P04_04915 [Bacteriovoracia bacterium]
MKAGTRKLVLFSLVVAGALGAANGVRAGGEIGNARYVKFRSALGGYETEYPRTWNNFDLGEIVGFMEDGVDAKLATNVGITRHDLGQVQSLDDLKAYVASKHPYLLPQSTEVDGRPGYLVQWRGKTSIYVFRGPAAVMQISYQIRADEQSRMDVEKILSSIKF